MGGCSSNMVTQLVKKYGQAQIMRYATSIIGSKLLGERFLAIKDQITQIFNNQPMNPGNYNQRMSTFDQIIKSVTNNQQRQIKKMQQNKPYIRQLDEGTPEYRNNFFKIIETQYANQVNQFKNNLIGSLGSVLNIDSYMNRNV